MHTLPNPAGTDQYKKIPFQFTEELSSKNVFVRLPEAFSPVERMILQASGNLQRLISAYYNIPSHVEIIYNNVMNSNNTNSSHSPSQSYTQYDRKIKMYFGDKMIYEADSILYVKDPTVLELIEKHKYGLGQIFGHTKRSPDFMLIAVGRHGNKPGASFWRDYSLRIPDVLDCFIRETFVEGLFNTTPPTEEEKLEGVIWFNQPPE
ncbi:unnamed protein product [Cunninghamella blakesleeana]